MDTKRFQVVTEKDIDPTQYAILDTLDNQVKVRYADKDKADAVCKDLNTKLQQ
jgi:hypothetical protein